MSNVWERFENIVSPEEVLEAKVQFEPLEEGNYACELIKLEPSESKSGLPMLKGEFKTDTGKRIFYNQMLQNLNNPKMTAVNIGEACKFLEGLTGEEVVFQSLGQLAQIVTQISEELTTTQKFYIVNVSYGAKDIEKKFPKLKIEEKLEDTPF